MSNLRTSLASIRDAASADKSPRATSDFGNDSSMADQTSGSSRQRKPSRYTAGTKADPNMKVLSIRKPADAPTPIAASRDDIAIADAPAAHKETFAMKGYKAALTDIGRRLLTGGLNLGLVAEVTTVLGTDDKKSKVGSAADRRSKSAPSPAVRASTTEQSQPGGFSPPTRDVLTSKAQHKLEVLDGIQSHLERCANTSPEPPPQLLQAGGHLLLCVVADTACAGRGSACFGDLGPRLGIGHFLRPLRDHRVKEHESAVSVVVLADALPRDWYTVAKQSGVFFVPGTPLSIDDLERAGFRKARAIAIVRGHGGGSVGPARVADARAILATTLIEAHRGENGAVITDLSYDTSCTFLPVDQVGQKMVSALVGGPSRRPAGGAAPTSLNGLFSSGVSAPTRAVTQWVSSDLGQRPYDEDYEQLEAFDYTQHPRFISGQVFVASVVMTSLLANTLHNPSLVEFFEALVQAPFLLLPMPGVWDRRSYADVSLWLLNEKNLIALGLYRSSHASLFEKASEEAMPAQHYMFSAPPAYDTVVYRTDRLLCLAPTG